MAPHPRVLLAMSHGDRKKRLLPRTCSSHVPRGPGSGSSPAHASRNVPRGSGRASSPAYVARPMNREWDGGKRAIPSPDYGHCEQSEAISRPSAPFPMQPAAFCLLQDSQIIQSGRNHPRTGRCRPPRDSLRTEPRSRGEAPRPGSPACVSHASGCRYAPRRGLR